MEAKGHKTNRGEKSSLLIITVGGMPYCVREKLPNCNRSCRKSSNASTPHTSEFAAKEKCFSIFKHGYQDMHGSLYGITFILLVFSFGFFTQYKS